MPRAFLAVLMLLIAISCNRMVTVEQADREMKEIDSESSSRVVFYRMQMRKKNFNFSEIEPCSYPEQVRKLNGVIISEGTFEDGVGAIKIDLYEDCCQKFGADYQVSNDSLVIFYESIGTEICDCKCLYHYELKLREPLKGITKIVTQKIESN